MSKRLSYITVVFGLCLSSAYCDGAGPENVAAPESSAIEAVEIQSPEFILTALPEEPSAPVITTPVAPVVIEQPFSPFTGKVKRQKVRLRANADLEGPIVQRTPQRRALGR